MNILFRADDATPKGEDQANHYQQKRNTLPQLPTLNVRRNAQKQYVNDVVPQLIRWNKSLTLRRIQLLGHYHKALVLRPYFLACNSVSMSSLATMQDRQQYRRFR